MKIIKIISVAIFLIITSNCSHDADLIFTAVKTNDYKMIKEALNNGIDVNIKDKNLNTPLLYVSKIGGIGAVKLLLDNRANVNSKNRDSWFPLHFAVKTGHYNLVRLLLEKGAVVNVQNKDSHTPLDLAKKYQHKRIIKLLEQKHIEVKKIKYPKKKGRWGLSNAQDVNIREGKGFHFKVIGGLNKHEKVRILEIDTSVSDKLVFLRDKIVVKWKGKKVELHKGKALTVVNRYKDLLKVKIDYKGQNIFAQIEKKHVIAVLGFVKLLTSRGITGYSVLNYINEMTGSGWEALECLIKGIQTDENKMEIALEHYKKAMSIDSEFIDAFIAAASMCVHLGLYDQAMRYLKKAERILKAYQEENTLLFAWVQHFLGWAHNSKGMSDLSLVHYFKARKIMENLDLKRTSSYGAVLNNIGLVYSDKNQKDMSLKYYLESAKIPENENFNKTRQYAISLNNIGVAYNNNNNIEKAYEYYKRSLKMHEELDKDDTDSYAVVLSNIGFYYRKKNKIKALIYYLRAMKIEEKLGISKTISYALTNHNIATILHNMKKSCKAIPYMEKYVEVISEIGQPDSVIQAGRGDLENLKIACDD